VALPAAASVVSGGLGAYPTIYYDRVAIAALEASLRLYEGCDKKVMPDRSGVAMQIFDYSAMSANLTPATEGTPGAGQTLTQNVRTLNLSQFVDYVSFSDKVVLTAISDTVAEGSKRLAYRGALSVDNIINNTVDATVNGTTSTIDVADGSFMTAALSRRAAQSLQSTNQPHRDNGKYFGVIHSLATFDLINDSAAGGFIDLMKYTEKNANKLQDGVTGSGLSDAYVGTVGGVEWYQSNALNTFAAWASSAKIAYSALVFAKSGIFVSSLGKTQLGQKNFGVKTSRFEPGTVSSDPAGQIRAAAAYNFFFGAINRPGALPGVRRIRVESSIG
jgi:N4-gp56 family major capsid protein